MAHSDDAQRALTVTPTGAATEAPPDAIDRPSAASTETPPPAPRTLSPRSLAITFLCALAACVLAYLAYAVPGRWFSSTTEKGYGVAQLSLPRGTAARSSDELVLTAAADDGNTVVSVTTDFRALDYPIVSWIASGFPPDARVALLWRSDAEPARVNKRVLEVDNALLLPADVHTDPHWIGRIVGLALVLQGPIEQPVHIRGVVAKPGDVVGTLRDLVREWTAPESWTGASINTIAAGADVQQLPLPVLLAVTTLVALAIAFALVRKSGRAAMPALAAAAGAFALISWAILDARFMTNLVRETRATVLRYAGKDSREKHLASDDRDLFAFIDKARSIIPPQPARVFVVADSDYFRGRAAYHLYPHNVWYEPYRNVVPPVERLRAGDWLVVYQRRGVQFDAARRSLRWDGGATVPVELKLLDQGGALFLVQ